MVGDTKMFHLIIYDIFDRYYRHFCNSRMFGLNAYSREIIECAYDEYGDLGLKMKTFME